MTESATSIPAAAVVDAEHPWPGLASFRESDRAFFHGREAESEALLRLVLRERLTVVFGISGLGKTSLLQAGLFPRVRDEHVFPIYVRLDFSESRAPLTAQIKAAIAREAERVGVEAPALRERDSLWELFHRQGADFWNARNRPVFPLLVLDQFEEVFTLGHRTDELAAETDALLGQLADLVEGRPPAELKARLDESPEEVKGFTFQRHAYKVLLSLREDFLPHLEELRERMRSIMHNRLRIHRMRGPAALAVVAQAQNLITADVAARVVRFVAGSAELDAGEESLADLEVEPALLSVVCRELNGRRLRQGLPRITVDLLEGTRQEIVQDLFERSVGDLHPGVRTFIEERLLTVSGFRDSVALENALESEGVDLAVIDKLVDRRLLRVEERGGVRRVELAHDVLTGVIGASRDRRRQREALDTAEAERRAAAERELQLQREKDLRRTKTYIWVLSISLIGAIAAVIWAVAAQRQAERNLAEAEESFKLAATYEGRFEQAEKVAEEAKREAQDLRQRAEALQQDLGVAAESLKGNDDYQRKVDERALANARELEREIDNAIRAVREAIERETTPDGGERGLDAVRSLLRDGATRIEQWQRDGSVPDRDLQRLEQNLAALPTLVREAERVSSARAKQGRVQITLVATGPNKIATIKAIRQWFGVGLKEAKELAETAGNPVLGSAESAQVREIMRSFASIGAEVAAQR